MTGSPKRSTAVIAIRSLTAAVAVAVATLASGCGGDADEQPKGSVTLVGDSLNVGIEPYLAAELPGWEIRHANEVGRRTDEGMSLMRSIRGQLAPVVVVSLGTNDVQDDGATFKRQVDDALALAGPRRCVVWSTVWLDGPNDLFNRILRDAAARHPNLEVADWAALIESEPTLLAPDQVHGSPAGYERKAAQVADIARRCHPRPESDQ